MDCPPGEISALGLPYSKEPTTVPWRRNAIRWSACWLGQSELASRPLPPRTPLSHGRARRGEIPSGLQDRCARCWVSCAQPADLVLIVNQTSLERKNSYPLKFGVG